MNTDFDLLRTVLKQLSNSLATLADKCEPINQIRLASPAEFKHLLNEHAVLTTFARRYLRVCSINDELLSKYIDNRIYDIELAFLLKKCRIDMPD